MASALRWGVAATFAGLTDAGLIKCQKDPEAREIPINIYYCDDTQPETECCEVDQQFTCCLPKEDHTLQEQMQLWGPIVAIVVMVFLACICYRKDSHICEGDTLKERMSSCFKPDKRKKKKKKKKGKKGKKGKKRPVRSSDKMKLVEEEGDGDLVEVLAHPYPDEPTKKQPDRPASGMSMVQGLVPGDFEERMRGASSPVPGAVLSLEDEKDLLG